MPNKNFSIYSPENERAFETSDQLLLEVGNSHLACLLLKEKNKSVSAFELFTFTENESADFSSLFSSVSKNSILLDKSYSKTEVFINNELSVLIPIFKFNKEIAADYLNIVFGEDNASKILFEHLPVESGMMNAFRVNPNLFDVLSTNLPRVSFRHTWSKVIRNLEGNFADKPEFISALFYDKYMTAVVIKDEKVQLIQSFVYDTPEDVLYYLLNITDRLQLNRNLSLHISGMIDLDFKLYRELIKYFQNVTVENADASNLLLDIKEHPLHYFTPFFNLAT